MLSFNDPPFNTLIWKEANGSTVRTLALFIFNEGLKENISYCLCNIIVSLAYFGELYTTAKIKCSNLNIYKKNKNNMKRCLWEALLLDFCKN